MAKLSTRRLPPKSVIWEIRVGHAYRRLLMWTQGKWVFEDHQLDGPNKPPTRVPKYARQWVQGVIGMQ